MIGVVATLEIQDGKQADFEATAKDLMAKVKANEPGCLTYQLYKAKGSDTTYIFMEQYASGEALAGAWPDRLFQGCATEPWSLPRRRAENRHVRYRRIGARHGSRFYPRGNRFPERGS